MDLVIYVMSERKGVSFLVIQSFVVQSCTRGVFELVSLYSLSVQFKRCTLSS